jgi:hypothetical protein
MRWSDLGAEPDILAALDHAGAQPLNGDQNSKRRWSESFANACAVAVANAVRSSALGNKTIRPMDLASGTEPLTPLGAGTSKRIDVTVVDPVLGLEVGFSLKGLNFRDSRSRNFDKNLTGRMYELADEVRLVHEHLPSAFMTGVFFLPIAATDDKVTGNSSFANAVTKLRNRTGRLDPALHAHASRCDASYVALYCLGGDADPFTRGATRFFNVTGNPPQRGRPLVEETLSLDQMVGQVVGAATREDQIAWGEAESDRPPDS